jgi:hypothetical protein
MRRQRGGLAEYERRLIVLQTRDGYSLRGAARVYADCIVLVGAERVDTEKPVQLGGEVIVLRENVSFFQTITQTTPVGDA